MRSGLRVRDEFYRQIAYACIAVYLIAFWSAFIFGVHAILGALGVTAESFWVGVFVLVVCLALCVACYQDVQHLLASLSAVRLRVRARVPAPVRLQDYRREAIRTKRGGWR